MDWKEKLRLIIEYAEDHLQRTEEEIDPREISKIAGCSFDFFQKVFSYMNGISFSDYIRYRKLTLAGYDLKSTNKKVLDISYQYGYSSPTSFTKAFQQFHGFPPKEARDSGAKLRVYPKMRFPVGQQYAWRLEEKEALRLIGKSVKIPCENNLAYEKIPEFWNECQRNGSFAQLISMDEGERKGLFGLFTSFSDDKSEMDYALMVLSDRELPAGFHEILLPKTTWAVFDCKGPVPEAIQKGWAYLNEEWLTQYPFRHAPCPEVEWYSEGNAYDKNYFSQIWIPVLEEEK